MNAKSAGIWIEWNELFKVQFTSRSFFSPFPSTVNFTDSLQFLSYDSEIYEAMLYPILYPSTFLLVVDTGKLGKIRRIHWKERLEIAKFESDTSSQSCINLRIIVRFWETAHILLP